MVKLKSKPTRSYLAPTIISKDIKIEEEDEVPKLSSNELLLSMFSSTSCVADGIANNSVVKEESAETQSVEETDTQNYHGHHSEIARALSLNLSGSSILNQNARQNTLYNSTGGGKVVVTPHSPVVSENQLQRSVIGINHGQNQRHFDTSNYYNIRAPRRVDNEPTPPLSVLNPSLASVLSSLKHPVQQSAAPSEASSPSSREDSRENARDNSRDLPSPSTSSMSNVPPIGIRRTPPAGQNKLPIIISKKPLIPSSQSAPTQMSFRPTPEQIEMLRQLSANASATTRVSITQPDGHPTPLLSICTTDAPSQSSSRSASPTLLPLHQIDAAGRTCRLAGPVVLETPVAGPNSPMNSQEESSPLAPNHIVSYNGQQTEVPDEIRCHLCDFPMKICFRKSKYKDEIREYPAYRCLRKGCQTFRAIRKVIEHDPSRGAARKRKSNKQQEIVNNLLSSAPEQLCGASPTTQLTPIPAGLLDGPPTKVIKEEPPSQMG